MRALRSKNLRLRILLRYIDECLIADMASIDERLRVLPVFSGRLLFVSTGILSAGNLRYAVVSPGRHYDQPLVWDVDKKRKTMDIIFQCLQEYGCTLKRWLYGHFHRSWCGERENVLFSILDIEEFKEIL